jgi:Fur family transcriptional regulator, zinc uptake regulator
MPRKGTKRRPAGEQDRIIVEALRDAGRPVSAYEIIDQLRGEVSLAPQTVYRALDRLIAAGTAHRVETLNAFVACAHLSHEGAAVFAICDACGEVTEFEEERAVECLAAWAKKKKFATRAMTLEIRGVCAACGAARSKSREVKNSSQ